MSRPRTGRAVVIGGGVAGLAAAGLMAREGRQVTVLDQGQHLGGRAGRWLVDGYAFDTGPSWYLMPEVFDRWFRLMGSSAAEQLELRLLDPGYSVFFEDGERVDISADRERNIALFESLSPGAGARLRTYLDSAAEAYRIAKRRFLYDDFRSPRGLLHRDVLRRAGELIGLMTRSLSDVTAEFPDPRLQRILQYPAVFLGASPSSAPAMYHLMSHLDLEQGVFYPRGGIAAVVDAMVGLCRDAGVEFRTEARATSITLHGTTRPRVTGVRWAGPDGREEHCAAEVVIGAADLHHIETMLLPARARSHPERRWASRNPGPGAVLACLGIDGPLPELGHHSLFFADAWRDGFTRVAEGLPPAARTSLYLCKPSASDPGTAPAGKENLFVLVPTAAQPAWGRGGLDGGGSARVEQIVDDALDQVTAWSGMPGDLAARVEVRRTWGPADFQQGVGAWRGGALGLAHTLRQSAFFRPGIASRKVSGLFYAGSSVRPGIGLPMCLISGELASAAARRSHPAPGGRPPGRERPGAAARAAGRSRGT